MAVDHRPLLARKADLIVRVVVFGIGVCALTGGLTAGAITYATTKPKEK